MKARKEHAQNSCSPKTVTRTCSGNLGYVNDECHSAETAREIVRLVMGDMTVQWPYAGVSRFNQDVLSLARRNFDRVEHSGLSEVNTVLGDVQKVLSVKVHRVSIDTNVGEAHAKPLAATESKGLVRGMCFAVHCEKVELHPRPVGLGDHRVHRVHGGSRVRAILEFWPHQHLGQTPLVQPEDHVSMISIPAIAFR